MNQGSGILTGSTSRRPLVLWTPGGLTLAIAAVGVTLAFIAPAIELDAAEQALRQHNPTEARTRLDRYLARWLGQQRALLLAAQAARQCDACADAERFLTEYEHRFRPTTA